MVSVFLMRPQLIPSREQTQSLPSLWPPVGLCGLSLLLPSHSGATHCCVIQLRQMSLELSPCPHYRDVQNRELDSPPFFASRLDLVVLLR